MGNIKKYNNKLNVIGNNIKHYRKSKNMSLVDLSNKLMFYGIDIHKNALQRLEYGRRIIKDYELGAISKVLNVSTDLLLKDFIDNLDS